MTSRRGVTRRNRARALLAQLDAVGWAAPTGPALFRDLRQLLSELAGQDEAPMV